MRSEVIMNFYYILLPRFPPSLLLGKHCISELLPLGSHVLLFYGNVIYVQRGVTSYSHSAPRSSLPGSTHTAFMNKSLSVHVILQISFTRHSLEVIKNSCDSTSAKGTRTFPISSTKHNGTLSYIAI